MKTSFGNIQIETLLDKYLEQSLKNGDLPQFYTILKRIEKIDIGFPTTIPVAFRNKQQLFKSTIEKILESVEVDLDVLYNVLTEIDNLKDIMSTKVDLSYIELNRMVTFLEEATAEISEDIVISNKFSSLSEIDTNLTTAEICLPEGIKLPTTGTAIKRLTLNKIYNTNFPINLQVSGPIKYNATDRYMPFYRPFWGEGAWRHEIITTTPKDYIDLSFDIPLDNRMFINGIRFKSLNHVDIEVYSTNDDTPINFVKLPGTGTYNKHGAYTSISFPSVLCTTIRVKARVYNTDIANNKHILSFSDFGIYSTGYSKEAKLVTKWYNLHGSVSKILIYPDTTIPEGSNISNEIEFSDNTKSSFRPGESISIGTVQNDDEIAGISSTRSQFITNYTYGTYNSMTFYKLPLSKCPVTGDIIDIKRGYNSMKMKTYTTRRTDSHINVYNTDSLSINIQDLYKPIEESKTKTALVLCTDNDLDINDETHTYYIKLDNPLVTSPDMPLISAISNNDISFSTAQEKSDNASIYYIKAILSSGLEIFINPNFITSISTDKTKIFFNDFLTSVQRSTLQTIIIAYKARQTSEIIPDSLSIFTNTGALLNKGSDYTIDYKNKQLILKSTKIGTLIVRYEADSGVADYTEFSTNFYAPSTIDTTLTALPVLSSTDKLYIDGIQLNTQKFPLLQKGYHTFILKTESETPLTTLYNALSIVNNGNRYIFFDLLTSPQSNLSSMKIVDKDYLLYNTYRLDSNVCAITEISGVKTIILPFIPYYESGSNCIFPVSLTDNTGTLIANAAEFTTYVSSNSERFNIRYNVVMTTTPEQFRLIFTLKRLSMELNVTPTLSGYEIHVR